MSTVSNDVSPRYKNLISLLLFKKKIISLLFYRKTYFSIIFTERIIFSIIFYQKNYFFDYSLICTFLEKPTFFLHVLVVFEMT